MKKLFLALAMTMMVGSVATVFATEAPTFDIEDAEGTTKVTYSVSDSYTITIPSEFSLETTAVEKDISASGVFIANAKKLQVTIAGKNCVDGAWYIVDESAGNSANKFEYMIKDDQDVEVQNNGVILEVEAGNNETVTESLSFELVDSVTKAGTYSDLLTFTAAVVNN